MASRIKVFDCDGHIIESIPEMAEFMDPGTRDVALRPSRNRQGVFAGLDGIHYPRNLLASGEGIKPTRERVNASDHRMGSAEDWISFLDKVGMEQTVMFPSEGLSVGFFQQADYAVGVCRAFNDYVAHRYRKVDPRLHPMGLIAMQDVKAAVKELRRLVVDLRLPGAMLRPAGSRSISVTITTGRHTRKLPIWVVSWESTVDQVSVWERIRLPIRGRRERCAILCRSLSKWSP